MKHTIEYATAVTLLKNGGMEKEAAHTAATLFQEITFPSVEEALATVKQFIELHAVHAGNAMALLEGAHKISLSKL